MQMIFPVIIRDGCCLQCMIALHLDSMIHRMTVRDAQLQFYANFHDNKEESLTCPANTRAHDSFRFIILATVCKQSAL